MNAAAKVLIFTATIAAALIVLIFYRYDIIPGFAVHTEQIKEAKAITPPSPIQEQKATNPVAAAPQTIWADTALSKSLANGKELYDAKCALCHGVTGRADKEPGLSMNATNLAKGEFRANKQNLPAKDYILDVIDNGVAGTAMISFKAQIPAEKDRKDVAAYVDALHTGISNK